MAPVIDVLIIGGGVIGLSALYHISRSRQQSVVLLEKGRIGSGASHQSGGFVRAFHPDRQRVDWAVRSLRYFRSRAEQTGFNAIGARYLPDMTDAQLCDAVKNVKAQGEVIQLFEQADFIDIAPELKDGERQHLLFEPNAGFADPLRTCLDFADQAQKHGASIIEGAEVCAIELQTDEIKVVTRHTAYRCRQLIVAAGAWSPKVLALFGQTSTVRSKKIQADFFHHQPGLFSEPSLLDQQQDVFSRPVAANLRMIGTATDDWDIDPDIAQVACAKQSESCLTKIKGLIGEAELVKSGGRVGFDGYSPRGKGEVKRADVDSRIIICDGFSGSGFQFAPAIGAQVAQMVDSSLKSHE